MIYCQMIKEGQNVVITFEDGSSLTGIVRKASIEQLYKTSARGRPELCEVNANLKVDIGKIEFDPNGFKLSMDIR